jgi:hypothetical protein
LPRKSTGIARFFFNKFPQRLIWISVGCFYSNIVSSRRAGGRDEERERERMTVRERGGGGGERKRERERERERERLHIYKSSRSSSLVI